jgi:hypothetical protein
LFSHEYTRTNSHTRAKRSNRLQKTVNPRYHVRYAFRGVRDCPSQILTRRSAAMSLTTPTSARRAGALIAAFGVLLAMLFVASPAQAAPTVTLTADDTTITLGQSVTLNWSASEATNVRASTDATAPADPTDAGDWHGQKPLNGPQDVTPTATGTFTYILAATDGETVGRDFVNVTVVAGPITPAAVTFPDPCTVVIPSTANVTYFVDYGDGDTEEVDADTYAGSDFSGPNLPVTFFAEANDGFTLADGAVAEWTYLAPLSCLGFGRDLVTATTTCGAVTFTNRTDGPLGVQFVSILEDDDFEELAQFTLAAGASRTVKTSSAVTAFGVSEDPENDDEGFVQVRYFEVPQDCGDGGSESGSGDSDGGSDHPTVAPAAGIVAR